MTPDRRSFLLAGGAAVASLAVPEVALADAPADAAKFIADHEKDIRPLEIAAGLAWWNANVSGKDSDFKNKEEAQNKIDAALSNPEKFATLKALKAAGDKGELKDPLVKRQIDLLYLGYLEKQVDGDLLKRITAKANAVEQQFNVFRTRWTARRCRTAKCGACSRPPAIPRSGRRCGRRASSSARPWRRI